MNYQKISSTLTSLIREFELRGAAMKDDHLSQPQVIRPQGFSISDTGELKATIFIHCDENAVLADSPDVQMRSNSGEIRTALITLDRTPAGILGETLNGLKTLTDNPEVHHLSASMRLKPLSDAAALKTGLNVFKDHNLSTGENVVIGFIDSGIDAEHLSFLGRIDRIWDQTITKTTQRKAKYGKILSDDSSRKECLDLSGHGTHVAGIAAGLHKQFGGVAPEATIVAVKTDFQSAHIADAIRYIFDVAGELDKPAVINLSLGGHLDAHDGTDELSKFINQETGAGKIVVAAAGNEADEHIHATMTIAPNNTIPPKNKQTLRFMMPDNENPNKAKQVMLRGWYASTGSCKINISTPSGALAKHAEQISDTENPTTRNTYNMDNLVDGNNTEVYLTAPRNTASLNGNHEFFADMRRIKEQENSALFLDRGEWELKIENLGDDSVTVDVWFWVAEGAPGMKFTHKLEEPDFTNSEAKIGSPGCAAEAITVASYTIRQVDKTLESISQFSSPGHSQNGNFKPDVAAPGAMIISARSQHSNPLSQNMIDADFCVNSGTSMAAAFITGVCALLLQKNPSLSPADIKRWMKDNSRIPGQAAGTHDIKWGFGLLDLSTLPDLP